MWDESQTNQGANEMASGFLKWVEISGTQNIYKNTIWSNCPSQNRKIIMMMCYFFLLCKILSLKIIKHKFLLKGNTYLAVDTAHSIIER